MEMGGKIFKSTIGNPPTVRCQRVVEDEKAPCTLEAMRNLSK